MADPAIQNFKPHILITGSPINHHQHQTPINYLITRKVLITLYTCISRPGYPSIPSPYCFRSVKKSVLYKGYHSSPKKLNKDAPYFFELAPSLHDK
ncbi:hypothetical protein Hanom_Chr07g00632611 [Helianthus anomalus]